MGIARLPQSKASIPLLIISANVTLRQGKEWCQPLQDIRTRTCFWEIISQPPGAQRAASEVSNQIAGCLQEATVTSRTVATGMSQCKIEDGLL